jgi:rhodanese-related sulfurtransferase
MAMKKGYKQLVDEANARIETLSVEAAMQLHGKEDVLFVDIRDPRELEREGMIAGAFHAPRGMLEFWIDPASPYYKDVFGAKKKFIFYCAGGLRSALATDIAQTMGLEPVAHIAGGFGEWKAKGGPVVERPARPEKKPAG